MEITFNLLHSFHSASNPNGDKDARRILHDCLVRLHHAPTADSRASFWINGCSVVWNLPEFFNEDTSDDDNSYALRCLLDCLIELNRSYLTYGPKIKIPKLYDSGVYYRRTQIWDSLPSLYSRGYGDCKSLTAALIAQYKHSGIECAPVFRFIRRNGSRGKTIDFHILVQTASGFEDPSKVLGMEDYLQSAD